MPFDGCAIFGNCAGTVLADITGFSVAPIYHRFRYLTRCKKNVELLRNQIQHLHEKRDGVQGAVDVATRNGEQIKADVRTWQREAEKFMAEAEKLDGEFEEKKIYLKWWHFNLRLRYKLSKEARRISYSVEGLTGIKATPAVLPASVESLSVSLPAPPPGIEFMSRQDFVAFGSTQLCLDQIFEALKDENCNMVGLYGMGGVGKTTLVKEVGKKIEEQKLFDEVVMAVVSQTQDVRKIQGQIADKLGLKFNEESESGRAGRLHERLKKEKTVLIILDDVWARLDLKAIGIPHGVEHEGCKIILTTRREAVCTVMGIQTKTKKIPVEILSNEESWDLFRRHVGVDIESTPLNVPAKAVVRECKGLPIALVTVGRALRDKELEDWNEAVQQLKKSKPETIEGMEQDVFSPIRLSYDFLRGEETKLCFLLCCLFPEDYNIEIEYLARCAMGKGLIKDVDTMVQARSRVHTIIKNLKASCMLLDSEKEGCVKMHDIVRDVAISIASSGGSHDLFLVRAGAGLKDWLRMETFESYTGISLMMNDFKELPQGLECPDLQILLLGENGDIEAIPEAFFEGMGMLKVLDLSKRMYYNPKRILSLPSSLKFLANLRTLHLDGCQLGNLSAIGMLKKLEILSFVRSDIRALPEEIGELINLRLLDLTDCYNLVKIPPNVISKLTRLEELYMGGCSFRNWEVEGGTTREERSSASLSELKLLRRLTILCVDVNGIARVPENNFLSPNLQKFEIEVRDEDDWDYIDDIDFKNYYTNSRRLYLECDEVPSSDDFKTLIQMVEELTLSEIKMRGSCDNILAGYCDAAGDQGLNGLKSLKLRSCDGIESLINYTNQSKPLPLANLEKLHLYRLDNMEIICRGGFIPYFGSLEKLRVLEIEDCPKLEGVDLVLQRLKNLEEVSVSDCDLVEEIFHLFNDEHANLVLLSSLRKLWLLRLPELRCIWKCYGSTTSTSLVSLHNLKQVDISQCYKLRNLFSPSLAQSLLNLESLTIERCDSLETIIIVAEEEEEEEGDNNNCVQPHPPVVFPKLKYIQVLDCPRLTGLFTIATARSRVRFHSVVDSYINSCEITFTDGNKEILLPQLEKLKLERLPIFESLCPRGFNMNFPSLKELEVDNCPMMKKNFAADATAYGLKSTPPNLVIVQDDHIFLSSAPEEEMEEEEMSEEDSERATRNEIEEGRKSISEQNDTLQGNDR